jgi:hypothetical protein
MQNPKTQRRAIGLLVVFATILTVIVTWNLPDTAGDPNIIPASKY